MEDEMMQTKNAPMLLFKDDSGREFLVQKKNYSREFICEEYRAQ